VGDHTAARLPGRVRLLRRRRAARRTARPRARARPRSRRPRAAARRRRHLVHPHLRATGARARHDQAAATRRRRRQLGEHARHGGVRRAAVLHHRRVSGGRVGGCCPAAERRRHLVAKRDHSSGSCLVRLREANEQKSGLTERAGFEPAMEFDPHTRLAGECLQPLGHLSLRSGSQFRAYGPRHAPAPPRSLPEAPRRSTAGRSIADHPARVMALHPISGERPRSFCDATRREERWRM
jgi:hypothetical protein